MQFSDYSLLQILLLSIVVFTGAIELGRWFGARASVKGSGNVSTLEGSVLGLVALMIGFTFAVALSRFEARREGVLNEANAIGTAAFRARLLPPPYDRECLDLFREYVDLRLNIERNISSPAQMNAAVARSNAIQQALWLRAKEVATKNNAMVPTGLFIQALNEMSGNDEKRLVALITGVPNIVLIVLYASAVIASAFAGYASGLDAQRSRAPVYAVIALFITVMLLIQDLDRPNEGYILVNQRALQDMAAALAVYER